MTSLIAVLGSGRKALACGVMSSPSASRLIRRGTLVCGVIGLAMLGACGGGGSASPAAQSPPVAAPAASTSATNTTTPTPAAPTIVTQPRSQPVPAGQPATFSVAAAGSGTLRYQWWRNGAAVEGATAATYTSAPVTLKDSGDVVRVAVSNDLGSVGSEAAAVLVEGVGTRLLAGRAPGVILERSDGLGKEALFLHAGSLALDGAGALLVLDARMRSIRKVSTEGLVTTSTYWPYATGGEHYPRHIAAGTGGALYVTDGASAERASVLRKIAADRTHSTLALPADPGDPLAADGSALPVNLTALATDTSGNVFVASEVTRTGPDECSSCYTRSMVRKIAPDGKVTLLLVIHSGPQTGIVKGLAADRSGNVYVLDAGKLVKIDAAGAVTTVMRNDLHYMNAIAVDAAGNLFFTAQTFSGVYSTWPHSAIGKVTPQGAVSIVADPAKDVRFDISPEWLDSPIALVADAAGVLYVSTPSRVRKLVLP